MRNGDATSRSEALIFLDAALIFEPPIIEAVTSEATTARCACELLDMSGTITSWWYMWREGNRRIISAGRSVKMAEKAIRQYSVDDLKAMRARRETQTRADAPTIELDEEFWRNARVVVPSSISTSVSLRLDHDVLEWFKAQERSYVTHINAVLRAYMEAQRRGERH